MNTPRLRFTLYARIMSLTLSILTPTIAAAHPSAGNGAHFWGDIIDDPSDKQYSDQFSNRHYARASAANLDVGEPRTVRLIYFLPNDRPYQAAVAQGLQAKIRAVQDFYATEMQAHGYRNITFRVETDPQGEPMVHRVDGEHPDSHYIIGGNSLEIFNIVHDEIGQQFDVHANIYAVVLDTSTDIGGGRGGRRGKNGGFALVGNNAGGKVLAHELGHAFGLQHNFNDDAYIMSYGNLQNRLSACSAEYLSVHPYFNPNVQSEYTAPTVELISPQIYPAEAKNVPIKLKVSDAAGLHQVILFVTTQTLQISAGFPEVKACQRLGGVTDTVVEFDYDGVTPSDSLTSLSAPTQHPITIEVIDVNGNTSYYYFNLESDSPESYIVDDIFDLYRGINLEGRSLASVLSEDPDWRRLAGLGLDYQNIRDLVEIVSALSGMPNLKRLDLNDNSISDLSPLSGLANLTELDLSYNSISDLSPLSGLTNLTELGLRANSISDLSPLSGLTNLTELGLGVNLISDLSPVSGLTNLTRLRLDGNSISDLSPVSGLTYLTDLRLHGDSISDLSPVSGLTYLTNLHLDGNGISDLSPVSGLTYLTNLRLKGNNSISDISAVSGLTNLTFLSLGGNSISDLSPVSGLTNLTDLRLNDNDISDISAVAGLPLLRYLAVHGNPLNYTSIYTHIPALQAQGVYVAFHERIVGFIKGSGGDQHIAPAASLPIAVTVHDSGDVPFAGVPVIFTLTSGSGTLSATAATTDRNGRAESTLTLGADVGTRTVEVSVAGIEQPLTFTIEGKQGVIIPDSNLRAKIGEVLGKGSADQINPSEIAKLTSLSAPNASISNLTGLEHATNLTVLGLGGNSISDLSPVSGLTNLTELTLGGNDISDISAVSGLTNLTELDLSYNSILDLSFVSGLTNLTVLGLGGNDISDLSFVSGLTNLTLLWLEGDSISDLSAVSGLTNLTELYLYGNSISDIAPLVASKGLDSGDTVDVRGNPLSYTSIHTHIPTLQGRGVEVYFDDRASPALLKISGDNQTGAATVALANPFVVEVQHSDGTGLAGIPVTFTVTAGDGTLSAIRTTTDANGRAESILTLGPHLGMNTVSASVKGVFSFHWGDRAVDWRVTFNAVADTESPQMAADVNDDGVVNILDLVSVADSLENETPSLTADVNGDGVVNVLDLILVAGLFESAAAAPAAGSQIPETLTAVEVQGWLTDAISLEIKDVIMKRGIVVLEQLLIALAPAVTELLPNYPNPFNPETWIPYRLAEDAFVRLTIYDLSGQVVRTLEVGHRIASAYETRSKAIYWEGRNGLGEQVASGVYFYHLSAGDYSATRRMVILK